MGSNERCNRRYCSHQLTEHRRAADGPRLLVGACQHEGCECAQYVSEGLTTGNHVLPIHGDHGKQASAAYLEPGDPFFERYLPAYRQRRAEEREVTALWAQVIGNPRRV